MTRLANYNYWCRNSECDVNMEVIQKQESEKEEPEYCSKCEGEMKLMGELVNFVGTFRSMNTEQRRAMLLKRSSEHFKKDSYLNQRKKELTDRADSGQTV